MLISFIPEVKSKLIFSQERTTHDNGSRKGAISKSSNRKYPFINSIVSRWPPYIDGGQIEIEIGQKQNNNSCDIETLFSEKNQRENKYPEEKKFLETNFVLKTPHKIVKPYDNPFWEKVI